MSVNVTVNGQSGPSVVATNGDTISAAVTKNATVNVSSSAAATPGGIGATGPQGAPSTTIAVGNVSTLSAGSSATVVGTSSNSGANLTLAFGIPAGATGAAGTTPTITASATTLSAGSNATVTATTTNSGANVALAFGIPTGAAGSGGSNLTLSDATPSALGTAAPGTSNLAARADHTHALPVIAYGNLSGVPANFPTNTTLVSGLSAGYSGIGHAHNYVTSLNNLTGGITLAAGSNVTLTTNGSTLTLSSSAGGLGANDAVDGGDYVGAILYGITFGTQPQSQTLNSSLTLGSWSNTSPPSALYVAGAPNVIVSMSPGGTWANSNQTAVISVSVSQNGASWPAVSNASVQVASISLESGYFDYTAATAVWDGSRFAGIHDFSVRNTGATTPTLTGSKTFFVASNGTPTYAGDGPLLQVGVFDGMLAYGNGTYLLIDTISAQRSTDMANWASASTTEVISGSPTGFESPTCAWFSGAFYVAGTRRNGNTYSGSRVIKSTDGYSWSTVYTDSANYQAWRLAASPTAMIASKHTAGAYTTILRTTNGSTWSTVSVPRPAYYLRWTGTRFVGLSESASYEYIWSLDGLDWNVATLPRSSSWQRIAGSNYGHVASDNGQQAIYALLSTSTASANLTVFASVSGGAAVSYQWQSSLDAGTTWANVSNATNTTLSLTGLTTANSGTRYRAGASATGATTAYSQSATLTVSG